MEKKILGLDLGTSSIGWALIQETENKKSIIAMGSRIIPLSNDDKNEFIAGNAISKNKKRTEKRTQRKGYDRYQLRRKALTEILIKNNMFDAELFKLKPLELWGLRAKSVSEKISLKELGRILYHLNQKRGYKSGRKEENTDKKDGNYVIEVKNRFQEIKEKGITIGQKFYEELKRNQYYRIKDQVFPREAYIEEFDKILNCQKKFYPEILTDQFIHKIRNEIIYYQRPLKSQKGLVSVCDFEGFWIKIKQEDGKEKEVFRGPKVAPKSSPLFQVTKIWENINNIILKNKNGEQLQISSEKKQAIFNYLDNNEKLSETELFKILEIKKEDGWYENEMIKNGLQGNITKFKILNALNGSQYEAKLLDLNLNIIESPEKTYLIDRKTGEVIDENNKKIISHHIENEPLYKLWHVIYSLSDENECIKTLVNKFGFTYEVAEKLAKIDFKTAGYGNKSVKAMRKILPYLMDGYKYADACSFAGYNHSFSLTNDELLQKQLKDKIQLLPKNSLRQPIVEKILNQLINIVNEILDENRGWVTRQDRLNNNFEIRIELARELKFSKKERKSISKIQRDREKENKEIIKKLEEYGLNATRNNIIKWRLFHEINAENQNHVNATCIYCGQPFGITDALTGNLVDVEHIIPKSLLFDDSQNNKTLSHRACNAEKGNRTAYDYMKSLGEDKFNQYVERINLLFKNKLISKAKRDKLLTPSDKIPQDFIDRQLRESQYIARKAKEILQTVCYNVWSTSGSVTEHLRKLWGYEDILMQLQLPKYREAGLTEYVEWESEGQIHKKEVIKGWTKRDDHRHHAVDALVIACTQQGFIQRMNTLSAQSTRDEMLAEIENQGKEYKQKLILLDKYLLSKRPFNTEEVKQKLAEILISYKAGKKVATFNSRKIKKNGKKIVVQKNILTPRGPLSEESVYGKIKIVDKAKDIKYLFKNPDLIINNHVRELIFSRLNEYNNDHKKAIASTKKDPIYLDKQNNVVLEKADCFKEEYVLKYPLNSIKLKDTHSIVDKKIKELVIQRLEEYNNNEKEAFKEPLYINKEKQIPIKTVRCFTGLTLVEPIKKDSSGKPIGFVKPGNNHHIAIYTDKDGNKIEHVCTFWHAVERKKYGIPIIIKDTTKVWDKILSQPEEKYPKSFLEKLPDNNLKLKLSLQQNEMFLLGLTDEEINSYIQEKNYAMLSEYLYRVQKIPRSDYYFRHHLETQIIDTKEAKELKRYFNIQSLQKLEKMNVTKVRIDKLGHISFP